MPARAPATRLGLPAIAATRAVPRRRPAAQTAAAPSWPATTTALVGVATPAYALLTWPQVWHNAAVLGAGGGGASAGAALSGLSPAAFAAAALGNAALLLHFLEGGETNAVSIQALGAAGNAAVVAQLTGAVGAVACVSVAVAAVAAARASRALPDGAWDLARTLTSLACAAAAAATAAVAVGAGPHAAVAAAGGAVFAATHVQLTTASSPLAWGATLLFAVGPAAALAAAASAGPAAAARSLAPPTLLLAAAANGLCAPRAAHVRDGAWLAGTVWGSGANVALAALAAAGGAVPPALVWSVAAGVAGLWAASVGQEAAWRREKRGV